MHSLVSKSRVFELTRFVEVRRFIYVSIQLNDFFFDIVECGFNSIDAFEDLARRLVEVLVEMEEDRSKSISFKFEEFFRKRFGADGKSVTVGITSWPMCQRENCNSPPHTFSSVLSRAIPLSHIPRQPCAFWPLSSHRRCLWLSLSPQRPQRR